jgi:hypothetical protein
LIVVDDEISSSFFLDNKGKNTIIGGWHCFVVVECGFIWEHNVLNSYVFLQSKGEPTLSTITIYSKFFGMIFPCKNVGVI